MDDDGNDVFVGIENNCKEDEGNELLKGNFVVIDGHKVQIDNESLFSNNNDNNNEVSEIKIDNSMIKIDKPLFSSNNYNLISNDNSEEELFNNKPKISKGFGKSNLFSQKKSYNEEETFSSKKSISKKKSITRNIGGFGRSNLFSKKIDYDDHEIYCNN